MKDKPSAQLRRAMPAVELPIRLANAVLGLDPSSTSPSALAGLLPQVLIPKEHVNKILHTKAKSKTKIEKFH